MARTNIKDLAKLLSLNPSTVSRALNDHPDIKPETIQRVKAAAKEFNYFPNLHARYFRKKTSGLIALIIPEFNMFFIPALMDGINEIIDRAGLSTIIFFSNNSYEKEIEIVNHCLSWVVEGVLISLSENSENCNHLMPLKNAGIPVVLLDKVAYTDEFMTVTIDDKLAAYHATSFLLQNDKKNILGIFGNPSLEITKKRVLGYKAAFEDLALPFSDYDIFYATSQNLIESKLKMTPYDAVFCMSDELLLLTYTCLRKMGLYPGPVSIMAISDGKLPYQIYPQVSHIHHSGKEIGQKAAGLLLAIKDKPSEYNEVIIQTEMVSLDSVFI